MTVKVSKDVVISAAPAEVMAVLADIEHWPDWSAVHKKTTVETKHADGRPAQCRMTVGAAGITEEQVVSYEWSGDEQVSWTLVKSSQQRSQDGHYRLRSNDANTEVHYEVETDLKVPIPGFIVKQVMKKGVEAATVGLKKRVESQH